MLVKNKKHLQGIGNNLVSSLADHPANYFPFWSHLYRPDKEIDIKLQLLTDNNFPEFLTGEQCQDMQNVLEEYRGFFRSHLERYKIDPEDIKDVYIHVVVPYESTQRRIFNTDFIVETVDGKSYTSTIVRTYWGNESEDIEIFDNGVMKKDAKQY